MKLSIKAMSSVFGIDLGSKHSACLLAAPGNASIRGWVLDGFSSIYPGFHGARSLADTLLGTGYAIVDGGVGGFLLAWLYNTFAHM